MRTTLNIDDDLLRKAMAGDEPCGPGMAETQARSQAAAFGFGPFPARGGTVTNELIDRLREETDDCRP